MKGTEVEFFVKTKGYDHYAKCIGVVRTSGKGYKILAITKCENVSRYSYYRADSDLRFILSDKVEEGGELHEVGHGKMFETLGILARA